MALRNNESTYIFFSLKEAKSISMAILSNAAEFML